MKKRGEAFINRNIEYRGVVFLNEQADESRCVAVGLEQKAGGNIRTFEKFESIKSDITIKEPQRGYSKPLKFTGVCLVQTWVNQIKNLVCVTNRGTVRVVQPHDMTLNP